MTSFLSYFIIYIAQAYFDALTIKCPDAQYVASDGSIREYGLLSGIYSPVAQVVRALH